MFEIFPILFTIVFVLILIVFIVTAVKGLGQWNRNNHAPRLTVPATVVSRRAHASHHHHAGDIHHSHTSTSYYVTFQFDSGDRQEFRMNGAEYGLLLEGDHGSLSFQGTRYLGFERD